MKNLGQPIFVNFADNSHGATVMENIVVRYNIMVDVGSTLTYTTGWGIYCGEEQGNATINNWNVYNNVIIASSIGSPTGWGISLPDGGVATNVRVNNNIIQGFDDSPVRANSWGGIRTLTNVDIANNIFYDNGYNNDVRIISGVTMSSYTNSGNLKSAPPFKSSTDYHLTSDRIGIFVSDGLKDKDGKPVENPPTIGAYEYGSTPIHSTLGKLINSNGKLIIKK